MTDGTSQGLFIVVAIVIFGIFTLMAYILFEDTLSPALASMFTEATEQASNKIDESKTYGSNLLIGGELEVLGPRDGHHSTPGAGDTDGINGKEFIYHKDLAPLFDTYGTGEYTLSFDLKASSPGTVLAYMIRYTDAKYFFPQQTIQATTEWVRYSYHIDVAEMSDYEFSNLVFFGGDYNTQRSPSVKNVKIEKGHVSNTPKFKKAPSWVSYE